jgi:hypothetical protein
MELVRKAEKVKNVAETWRRTYQRLSGEWGPVMRGSSKDYYDKLLEAKTEDEINAIIGNTFWTKNDCHVCGNDCDVLISFVVEEYNFNVCRACLERSIELIKTSSDSV